ncbi:hypothetical protein QQX98_012014 [Neonectria punicea]|uniref:Nudix hydrolase domain-containing protein n=1 Tax=Neonectria punicea TaxID=979145 RepID=A0ABR1GK66_9HYPO
MATSTARSLFFANQFAISCGTVTVDVSRAKVLLIRCRRTGEYMLPKGRKDIGEGLEHTATRETFEETGIPAQLLPVDIETMATMPSSIMGKGSPKVVTEPLAVTQRVNKGVLKIIFWYVGSADSAVAREEGTQNEDEGYDTIWVGFNEVESTLRFDDDKGVAREAIGAVSRGQAA